MQDLSQVTIIYTWAFCVYLSNTEPEIIVTINEVNLPQPPHTRSPNYIDPSLWGTGCGVCLTPTWIFNSLLGSPEVTPGILTHLITFLFFSQPTLKPLRSEFLKGPRIISLPEMLNQLRWTAVNVNPLESVTSMKGLEKPRTWQLQGMIGGERRAREDLWTLLNITSFPPSILWHGQFPFSLSLIYLI